SLAHLVGRERRSMHRDSAAIGTPDPADPDERRRTHSCVPLARGVTDLARRLLPRARAVRAGTGTAVQADPAGQRLLLYLQHQQRDGGRRARRREAGRQPGHRRHSGPGAGQVIRHARPWWTDELGQLKETASAFFTREVGAHREKWDAQQQVDREVWSKAGGLGLLCASVPECYGGGGGTYAHEAVLLEEQA